jgi:hypothetical protein
VKGWAGALENYRFGEQDGTSTLALEMDVTDEYRSYFEETWPKALSRLKAISERNDGRSHKKLRHGSAFESRATNDPMIATRIPINAKITASRASFRIIVSLTRKAYAPLRYTAYVSANFFPFSGA